jgi:hypothetical protein
VRRIAITGHVNVPEDMYPWVRQALTDQLVEVIGPGVRFVTCLARGADQLFAEAVLRLSGTLDVVLPARDYGRRMAEAGHEQPFESLLAGASQIRTLDFAESSRDAYLAASLDMLNDCDLLLAVWDGRPSQNVGDTADVVREARERSVRVEVVWPAGPRDRPEPTAPAAACAVFRTSLVRQAVAPGPG